MNKITTLIILLALSGASSVYAKGAGTSGGLTLIEATSARASSLGEAYSAMTDDIAAFGYNPASLGSMQSGQAAFLYQQGLVDDSYGHFMIGGPSRKGSIGLSLGYYNGGEMELYDGVTERTVTSQRDLALALGYARDIGPVTFGMTGKYLSSELIETEKATAFAGDFGLSVPVMSRLRIGAAVQNIGTQLKFIEEGDDLPRIARAGFALALIPQKYVTTLLVDAPYFLNEEELRPSVGLEVSIGVLSLRGGYKSGSDLQEFSVGTGFQLGRSSLDYSFGLADKLDSQHRVSLAMRFGGGAVTPAFTKKEKQEPAVAEKPVLDKEAKPVVVQERRHTIGESVSAKPVRKAARRVYTVRHGDTLATIAAKTYGDSRQWKSIYTANKHLIENPRNIEVGQKIILP